MHANRVDWYRWLLQQFIGIHPGTRAKPVVVGTGHGCQFRFRRPIITYEVPGLGQEAGLCCESLPTVDSVCRIHLKSIGVGAYGSSAEESEGIPIQEVYNIVNKNIIEIYSIIMTLL